METEELIKLVDGIYKNILDKFNPGARQMINAGKAYLKALHGAAAASRMYVDAISKLAKQAQQGTWGGSSDIGAALMKIVEVYKEIQDQQMNILKAFYVDLLVPLETNLEKDTKVVQSEQKRFLQQHKQRSETYSKAAAMMKKQRKKSRGSTKTGLAMDKELKNMQVLEEEKTKLDAFCEQSLKNAMTQERRRYGFVLERHCSLAKHYLSYHSYGVETYQQNIEKWSEVAKTREYLPESVENIFSNRLRQISVWQDDDLYSNPRSPNFEDDRMSINSQLRKTKSMDASCLDIRSIGDVGSPVNTLSRAKSEFNLNSSQHSLAQDPHQTPGRRPKSMAVPPPPSWDTQLARALYAYLSSGENQLSFHEGDLIALIGERNKGWQFGENLRTQCSGWFPLAYTEVLADESALSPSHRSEAGSSGQHHHSNATTPTNRNSMGGSAVEPPGGNDQHPARMFGDTLHLHRSSNNAKQIRRAIGSNSIPPPGVPAPVPTPTIPAKMTQSQSATFGAATVAGGAAGGYQAPFGAAGAAPGAVKPSASAFGLAGGTQAQQQPAPAGPYSTHPAPAGRPTAPLPLHLQGKAGKIGGPVGNVSLHSSNDSGFSNDPPPQPEIDYSDDDSIPGQTKLSSKRRPTRQNGDANNNTMRSMRKPTTNPVKQANSHGNLVENKYYASDVDETSKVKVKRTKSFWKFGKNSSDTEILEGMSLWKHRDLVDVDEEKKKNKINSQRRIRRPSREENKIEKNSRHSRDKSNDSDRTINNNNVDEIRKEEKRSQSSKDKQKMSRKESTLKKHDDDDDDFENIYERKPSKFDDQFYDDDGDGLMLKTVNRKNILQQYSDDISLRSDSGSDESSDDDPYDCIVVDDQKVKKEKKDGDFPNVAELGKKLEKLSKNSKYSPNKNVREKNEKNSEHQKQMLDIERDEVIQYNERNRTFKTFKQNDENGEEESIDYYKSGTQEKRHKYNENSNKTNTIERKNRPSYESIEAEQRNGESKKHNKESNRSRKDKMKYYDSTNDELSDVGDNRQFLPRTKLTKTNSNSSKYEPEVGLMEYGETLQRRLKNPEYNSKFDEKSPHNGNMYGPWYDLWGLDSSSRK